MTIKLVDTDLPEELRELRQADRKAKRKLTTLAAFVQMQRAVQQKDGFKPAKALKADKWIGVKQGHLTVTGIRRGQDAKGNHRVYVTAQCDCGATYDNLLSRISVDGLTRCSRSCEAAKEVE